MGNLAVQSNAVQEMEEFGSTVNPSVPEYGEPDHNANQSLAPPPPEEEEEEYPEEGSGETSLQWSVPRHDGSHDVLVTDDSGIWFWRNTPHHGTYTVGPMYDAGNISKSLAAEKMVE